MPSRAVSAVATIGGIGAACVAYGVLFERRWYRLTEVALPGTLRRPAGRPMRILHVSDVHLDPPQDHRVRFLQDLARHDVDLIVATGDLLGATGAEEAAVAAMAPLTADGTPGLLVLGSNDYFGPAPKNPFIYMLDPDARIHGRALDTDLLVKGLGGHGWTTLVDDTAVIETALGPVAVGGLNDPHLEDSVLPPREAILPPTDDAVLNLGLVHAPYTDALDLLVDAGYDLLLAGHTHGGQVRLPGVGALVANCDLPLDQARGESRWYETWLHVSAGLGHSRYAPFRFACRPEATILEIS